MSAMFAQRLLRFREVDMNKDIEKLSSGMRINKGGDDASGLAVSEKLRSQIRGLQQANRNIENAISFIQTSEGYLQETQDVIHRLRELSVQAANGIYSDEDRMQIQVEVSQLVDEVNRIASHAQFNEMNLLTGKFANAQATGGTEVAQLYFHVGANEDQNERVYIGTMTAEALNIIGPQASATGSMINVATPEEANLAITALDDALKIVSKQRADLGAYQNRFEMASKGVAVAAENMQAAESRIRDTDMAEQMVSYVKNQILMQAGTAMVANANMKTQAVLALLQ
jgi:flagellin